MFSNLKYEEKNVKITNHPTPFSASIKANLIFLTNSHIGYYNYYSDIHSGSTLWNLATIQF